MATMARMFIALTRMLPGNPPLKRVAWNEEELLRKEQKGLMQRWSAVPEKRTGGNQESHNWKGHPRRALEETKRRKFPNVMGSASPLTTDQKGSSLTWYLQWLTGRGTRTSQHKKALGVLRKVVMSADEQHILKIVMTELAGNPGAVRGPTRMNREQRRRRHVERNMRVDCTTEGKRGRTSFAVRERYDE